MNFEFNKIAGAVLGTALGVMVVGIVADTIYEPRVSEEPGFVIAVAEPGEGGGEGPAAPQVEPIADRLQVASAEDGAKDVAKCKTCHTFEKGEPNKVGPNLWDVVGHNVIHGDFAYSDAMRAKGAEGLEWTYENLDHFIENPKKFIPGTAMSFAGVKDPGQRADIIAYLRTLSDSPMPLPPPTPAATETPEAGGETPPATETPPAAGENPPAATETPPAEAPAAPPATEEPAPAPEPATPPAAEPAPAPEPATPPAAEPAPEPATPPAAEPAPEPAPEPATPPAAEPTPEPATPPAAEPAPAPETPAPTPTAPVEDQPASSGQSDGAAPAPAAAPEPTMAPTPDAEADSPEGAPASATPAQ